jgi:signal peptidase
MNEMKLRQILQIQVLALLFIVLAFLLLAIGPAIKKGAIAIGKPTAPEDLKVGDVVAFKTATGDAPTMHRIVEIERHNGAYIVTTKGDANQSNDPDAIVVRQYGSKIIYSLPYIGYILEAPRALLGPRLTFVLPTMILGVLVLWEIWSPLLLKSRRKGQEADAPNTEGLAAVPGAG